MSGEQLPGLPDEYLPVGDRDRVAALAVACPGCGAPAGESCRTVTGRPLESLPAHPRRYRAAGITTSTIPTPEQP
ncbi:MAG: hypothetical protein L0H84_21710 [Pseudonocardia sp.]|nr:hypothetical protein [Pseudonocardia sp.]